MAIESTDSSRQDGDVQLAGYRSAVREVVDRWLPEVPTWEREGHLPRELHGDLGAAGVFRGRWAHGRTGGLRHAVAVAQEVADLGGGASVAVTVHQEVVVGALTRLARTPAQVEVHEGMLDGELIGCFASSEDHGGSDMEHPRTTISRRGDGWHLQGTKRYCTNAARSSHCVAVARCADAPAGRDSVLVLIDLSLPGVEVAGSFPTATLRSSDTSFLRFDAQLPDDALLGRIGTGLLHASHGLVLERASVSAQALRTARRALDLAIAYARSRPMGGERLMDKQALRHRFADAATQLAAADALHEADQPIPETQTKEVPA